MTHRKQSGWKHWKRVSGILCDRRISFRVKGKVHKTVVRPENDVRCRDFGSDESTREEVGCGGNEDVNMDEWTKLDRIRNGIIRGTTKVGEISKIVQESKLKWYGHVLRRSDEYVGKRVMGMEVSGKRRRGRTKAGAVG